MIEWEINCGPAKPKGFHIQARTKDQMCSFVLVLPDLSTVFRGKSVGEKFDTFTATMGTGQGTMNVLGKIKYTGEWPKS